MVEWLTRHEWHPVHARYSDTETLRERRRRETERNIQIATLALAHRVGFERVSTDVIARESLKVG